MALPRIRLLGSFQKEKKEILLYPVADLLLYSLSGSYPATGRQTYPVLLPVPDSGPDRFPSPLLGRFPDCPADRCGQTAYVRLYRSQIPYPDRPYCRHSVHSSWR